MKKFVVVASSILFGSMNVMAQGSKTPSKSENFEYPELLVSPSASDRLKQEAAKSQKNRWTQHITLQLPALNTLAAGMLAMGDPGRKEAKDGETAQSKSAGLFAVTVGGGWLALTAGMAALYSPYQTAVQEAKAADSKRGTLASERTAEEGLSGPARFASTLKWLSLFSNLAANGYVIGTCKNDMTVVVSALGVFTSFIPILFSHPWISTWEYHQDYKKRIYGPLTAQIFLNEKGDQLSPGFSWSMMF